MQIRNIYRLEDLGYRSKSNLLGNGLYGKVEVYEKNSQLFAIKTIQTHVENKSYQLKQIEICKILLKEKHQNIVQIFDIVKSQKLKQFYIIMEYIPQKELFSNKILRKVEEKYEIILGILRGLVFLHQHRIIHRNLKPSNILITKKNGKPIPKLCDFGIRIILKNKFIQSNFAGNQSYIPPETDIVKDFDLKADVWEFGVIAYQFLTNYNPFQLINSNQKIEKANKLRILKRIFSKIFIAKSNRITSQQLLKQMEKPLQHSQKMQIIKNEKIQNFVKQQQNEIITLSKEKQKPLVKKISIKNKSISKINTEADKSFTKKINTTFVKNQLNYQQTFQIQHNKLTSQIKKLKDLNQKLIQQSKIYKEENQNLKKQKEAIEKREKHFKQQRQKLFESQKQLKEALNKQKQINESQIQVIENFNQKEKQLKKVLIQKCKLLIQLQKNTQKIKQSYENFIDNKINQLQGVFLSKNDHFNQDILDNDWKNNITTRFNQLKIKYSQNNNIYASQILSNDNSKTLKIVLENQKYDQTINNLTMDLNKMKKTQKLLIEYYSKIFEQDGKGTKQKQLFKKCSFQKFTLQMLFSRYASQIKKLKENNQTLQKQLEKLKQLESQNLIFVDYDQINHNLQQNKQQKRPKRVRKVP